MRNSCYMNKLLLLFIIAYLFSIVNVFPQENFSIHKYENDKYGSVLTDQSEFDISGKGIIPLQNIKSKDLTHLVYGFLPDWEYQNNYHNYLRYDLLTHLACFDFTVNDNGSMNNPSGWPWTNLINTAHSNGVKVILTAVSFDADLISSLIDNESVRNTFFNGIKSKVITYQLDGVNIDFESLNNADKGDRINGFMAKLRAFMDTEIPGKELSYATPAVNWGDRWKFDDLAESCDHLFIMGYSYYGSWSGSTGPCAPYDGGSNNILSILNDDYASLVSSHPEKLILGVPYYGLHWTTESQYERSNVVEWVSSTRFRNDQINGPNYGVLWSDYFQNPWYKYQSGGDWHQIWYDNFESLEIKYDFAKSKNIGGVGMWALGYDGARPELWDLLDVKFGSGQAVPPAKPTGVYAKGYNSSTIKLGANYGSEADGLLVYYKTRESEQFDSLYMYGDTRYVNDLEGNKIYDFDLYAFNAAGLSESVGTVSAVTSVNSRKTLIVNGVKGDYNEGNKLIDKWEAALFSKLAGFSTCVNTAVEENSTLLNEFTYVVWVAGQQEENVISAEEQESIILFLKSGRNLLISGSNIAYSLGGPNSSGADKQFLQDILKSSFVSNSPNNTSGVYYSVNSSGDESIFNTVGEIFYTDGTNGSLNVDKPDVISTANPALYFSGTNFTAGMQYSGIYDGATYAADVVFLTFPVEAIEDTASFNAVSNAVYNFFDNVSNIDFGVSAVPDEFVLMGNYPNPFNPETKISFGLPVKGEVTLNIYSVTGEKIYTHNAGILSEGINTLKWNPGVNVSSGVYLYTIGFNNSNNAKFKTGKMLFLK